MQYRSLGRTGIQVSPYALGTMNFGVMANADHDETAGIIRKALDAGINLIDTADVYSRGKVRAIGTSKQPAAGIVEAQWASERMGFERFRCEQPHYSILNRGIEREILPAVQRYGMGAIVWSPLAQGLLTGRIRKGQPSASNRTGPYFEHLSDEARIDVVEQLIQVAQAAAISLTHLAIAFAIAHPAVTAAILGPRTPEQLDDLLAGAGVALSDDILDQIDAIVPPGTDVGQLQMGYRPFVLTTPSLRRRPTGERLA